MLFWRLMSACCDVPRWYLLVLQGKPGGANSMLFDKVAPALPIGWKWVEEDWEIDMEGFDQVSSKGWASGEAEVNR